MHFSSIEFGQRALISHIGDVFESGRLVAMTEQGESLFGKDLFITIGMNF